MDSEAADLVLEVAELGLAGLLIVNDGILVDSDAHSLEVSDSSVYEVSTDTDVTALAGALLMHELKCLTCEGGLAGNAVGKTEHSIKKLCRRGI